MLATAQVQRLLGRIPAIAGSARLPNTDAHGQLCPIRELQENLAAVGWIVIDSELSY